MHAEVRSYTGKGAKELFDLLEKKKAEVEKEMRTTKGFVSYTLARTSDGGFSVTICKDKAGADDSLKKAKEWIAKNASGISVGPPVVSEGPVLIHTKKTTK